MRGLKAVELPLWLGERDMVPRGLIGGCAGRAMGIANWLDVGGGERGG